MSAKKVEGNKGIEDRNEQKKWGSAFEKPKNIDVRDPNFEEEGKNFLKCGEIFRKQLRDRR